MKFSLRVKLSAAFLLVSFLPVLFIGVFANYFFEKQFKEYIISKQDREINNAVAMITDQYQTSDQQWNHDGIESIGVNMLGEGLIIRVKDANDAVVWDARVHNSGMCTSILENMADNMQEYNPNFKGSYIERNYPVIADGKQIGSVDIGYYGPYFYSDTDVQYINTLNNLLWIAAALALVVCIAVGVYMARRLTKPIGRVVRTTGKIAKGEYADRIQEKSSTAEIIELTDSVNSLAASLSHQEKLRKRLTADVAHELRTPLATLQSHMEAMIDGIWEPDQARLLSCHEEILRLSKLVGELEMLSRYEGENLVLKKERFDLGATIRRLLINFENEFKTKGVSLSYHDKEQWIEADEDKISQVLINLLSNALKHTPAGGAVSVDTKNAGESVQISVSDTGYGIAPEELPFIFERFYRTDRSRDRATGGAGIGLTIAKAIIEAHNGSIFVESEPDKGSIFVVSLPADISR